MALWYVRLRKAAKTRVFHTDLLKAERLAGPCKNNLDPISTIRRAKLSNDDVEEIKESRAQGDSDENDFSSEEEQEEGDMEDLLRKEAAKYRSAEAKR